MPMNADAACLETSELDAIGGNARDTRMLVVFQKDSRRPLNCAVGEWCVSRAFHVVMATGFSASCWRPVEFHTLPGPGTPRGRSSACEQRDNCPTLPSQKYVSSNGLGQSVSQLISQNQTSVYS